MERNEYDVNLRYGVDSRMSLAGKVAVITGGLGGIAMAANRLLLEKGARLVLMYPAFEQDKAAAALRELGDEQVFCQVCDVTEPDSVAAAFNAAERRFGRLDILVNCAGYVNLQPATEVTLEEWQRHLAITAGHGGKIINIASQAASIAIDDHCAYTSAKAGLLGMTKVMAKEWAPHGITVNTLSPTVVLTPMGEKAWRGEKGEAMKKLIPLGRFAYTDEIAAAILFFASNGSDMITGADLMIDGGFTIW
jgi:NAD(P)-dependent dehydrogenase (short-subunit alcohol dehydrogenase family)